MGCTRPVLDADKSKETGADVTSDLRMQRIEDSSKIENLFRLTNRVYSGGEPATEDSMKRLSELGVKTIISVDGAQPNVQLAGAYGMRYVHIPIGYDGVAKDAGEALAKAVREVEGPIFVHCHHGKHRGPAAAAICAIAEVGLTPAQATRILEMAGTSSDYAGLWRDVASYQPPDSTEDLPPLVEFATVDNFVAAMASIGRSHDHLKLLKSSDWEQRTDHPDLVAQQEALILYEGFRESLRFLEQSNPYDESIKQDMFRSIRLVENLQQRLGEGDVEGANELFGAIQANCKNCHKTYRD